MRQISINQAARMARCGPGRKAFVNAAPGCMCCHFAPATDCHEIARGAHRSKAYEDRITWLAVCRVCNCVALDGYAEWPLTRQLALKWIYDREHFDLEGFNRLRGRAPGAITMAEVVPWICRELDA